jgi:hypothetical protein
MEEPPIDRGEMSSHLQTTFSWAAQVGQYIAPNSSMVIEIAVKCQLRFAVRSSVPRQCARINGGLRSLLQDEDKGKISEVKPTMTGASKKRNFARIEIDKQERIPLEAAKTQAWL